MRELFLEKDKETHTKAFQRMKDTFHQESFPEICKENSNLRTYTLIKNTIGNEKYLNKIENTQERISLTTFILAYHIMN